MYKNRSQVEILVNGNPVTEYEKNGNLYIEGRRGSEYSIRIRNDSWVRILAIPTVDGLSVLDGKPGSIEKSPGYIIPGYTSYVIEGWRTDLENIRKFQFSRNNKSYGAKSGQGTNNNGVIGVSLFLEKQNFFSQTRSPSPIFKGCFGGSSALNNKLMPSNYYASDNDPDYLIAGANSLDINFSYTSSESVERSLGTAMGRKEQSIVTEGNFNKEEIPFSTFVFYYLERKQLQKIGIIPHTNYNLKNPNPFPKSKNFCKEV